MEPGPVEDPCPAAACGLRGSVPLAVAAAKDGGPFVHPGEFGDDVGALLVGHAGRVRAPDAFL